MHPGGAGHRPLSAYQTMPAGPCLPGPSASVLIQELSTEYEVLSDR